MVWKAGSARTDYFRVASGSENTVVRAYLVGENGRARRKSSDGLGHVDGRDGTVGIDDGGWHDSSAGRDGHGCCCPRCGNLGDHLLCSVLIDGLVDGLLKLLAEVCGRLLS